MPTSWSENTTLDESKLDKCIDSPEMLTREDIWDKILSPLFLHQFLSVIDEEEFKAEDTKHDTT